MIRNCPNCKQIYETSKNAGICPHCGTSPRFSGIALTIIIFVAVFLVGLGSLFLYRPLTPAPEPKPPRLIPAEVPVSEFPAARATIRPPRNWTYQQRDDTSVAFSYKMGGAIVRLRDVPVTRGAEQHLALFRELVPAVEPAETVLPQWNGVESIAVSLAGDSRIGASWLVPNGDRMVEVVFWGNSMRIDDIPKFLDGLKLSAPAEVPK